MKIRLFAILFCTVIAGVSCIHEFPVTDHSFDFTGEIIYDSETDQHRLTLTCKKKSATDQFDIVFHVDGENVITLTDMDGVTHQGWFSESFADTDSRTYILSGAPVGKHLLDMTISTEGFCQSIEIEYEVTRQKYELHFEVGTSGAECSSLLISLSDGDSRYLYSVEVELDGKGIATFDIDFTKKPIYTMSLPEGLRPGKHSVTLYVSDSMTGKLIPLNFRSLSGTSILMSPCLMTRPPDITWQNSELIHILSASTSRRIWRSTANVPTFHLMQRKTSGGETITMTI